MKLQVAIRGLCATASIAGLMPAMASVGELPPPAIAALPNQAVIQQHSAPPVAQAAVQQRRFDPTWVYRQESVHGFTLLINPAVLKHPMAAQELRQELAVQLAAIGRVMPAKPLSILQKVRIWVEWAQRSNGAAEFHPSAVWLRQHGYNPDKAGCVEVSNASNFVRWSRAEQPWMLLHELAHAYHHRIPRHIAVAIQTAYHQALNQKLYESVSYIQGGKQRAYALTHEQEYFAELSEAYFGKNDFYPFTQAQLQHYDPVGYQLMKKIWGRPRQTEPNH